MYRTHSIRTRSLLLVGALLALMFSVTTVARAESFGEVTRFGGPSELNPERTEFGALVQHIIGVNSVENSVFVLEESTPPTENAKEEETRTFVLKEFSSAGKLLAESKAFKYKSPPSPDNAEETDTIEGLAVDPAGERVYFLVDDARNELVPDEETSVAATLYAYSTKAKAGKLEAASGTKEGVLAGEEVLEAQSNTAGKALLEPAGITVDPATHEVIVLGHIDEKGEKVDSVANPGDHYVLQRIKSTGTLGERYVDTTNFLKGEDARKTCPPHRS